MPIEEGSDSQQLDLADTDVEELDVSSSESLKEDNGLEEN